MNRSRKMVLCLGLAALAGCGSSASDNSGSPSSGGSGTMNAGASGQGEGQAGTVGGAGSAAAGALSGSSGALSTSGAGGSPVVSAGSGNSGAGAGGLDAAAGSSVGATGGASGSAGASASGCAGLLLCDDFESYAPGAAPNGRWQTQTRGTAKAVIDTAMAYSGSHSVHFTGTVNQSSANIIAQGAPVFPVHGDTVFVRLMMYVQGYPATSGVHTRLARIGTSTSGLDGTGYAMTTYNGTGVERINEAMVRDTTLHLTDALVKGKWVCWEWELDNTAGPPMGGKGKVLAHLWRDGGAVTLGGTSHTGLSWDPVAWQVLEIGLEAYQADSQAGDFWIDDVAMNTQKIGCPQK